MAENNQYGPEVTLLYPKRVNQPVVKTLKEIFTKRGIPLLIEGYDPKDAVFVLSFNTKYYLDIDVENPESVDEDNIKRRSGNNKIYLSNVKYNLEVSRAIDQNKLSGVFGILYKVRLPDIEEIRNNLDDVIKYCLLQPELAFGEGVEFSQNAMEYSCVNEFQSEIDIVSILDDGLILDELDICYFVMFVGNTDAFPDGVDPIPTVKLSLVGYEL